MDPWLTDWLARSELKALLARGREVGALTFDEVNATLPEQSTPDQLAEVHEILEQHGISLIDDPDAEEPLAPAALPPDPERERLAAELEAADHLGHRYHRNADFERLLRSNGVTFSDAVTSFELTGAVFDADLIVPGEQALAAWLALRNLVRFTGLWPVIEGDRPGPTFTGEPDLLDPGGRFDAWWKRFRADPNTPHFEFSPDTIRADAAAQVAEADKVPPTPWAFRRFRGSDRLPPRPGDPDDAREPPEPDFAALFSNAGPFRAHKQGGGHTDYPTFPFVRVRLYPAAVPWEVFAYSPFGGWNDCPYPDEQLTMIRHWHSLCGVEVVSRLGDWYELFVPRPPRTRHQAYWLDKEMNYFAEETFYNYGRYAHPDPIEAIRTSHYWYFWWD